MRGMSVRVSLALALVCVVALAGVRGARAQSWERSQNVVPSDAPSARRFGAYVSVSGDYALISAPECTTDEGVSVSGCVYVFSRVGSSWRQVQKLTGDVEDESEAFGYGVSLSGDYALIGAYRGRGANRERCGVAYVFARVGSTWIQVQKLTASDGANGDRFGYHVSLSGDYALIGAYQDGYRSLGEYGSEYIGSAYVFARVGPTWIQVQKLTASDTANVTVFGYRVLLSGDYAFISANTGRGSVYVFTRSASGWTQVQKLTAPDGGENDRFGADVSASGDYALISASNTTNNGVQSSGSAYIFARSELGWTQVSKLTASDAASFDRFGYSVAISSHRALIAAFASDENGENWHGGLYTFVRSGSTWTQAQKLTAKIGAANDSFGGAVVLSGQTVLVGAPRHDANGEDSGSAYFFTLPEVSSSSPKLTPIVAIFVALTAILSI